MFKFFRERNLSILNHQSVVVSLFHFNATLTTKQKKLNSSIISSDVFNVPQRQSHTFSIKSFFPCSVSFKIGDPLTEMHIFQKKQIAEKLNVLFLKTNDKVQAFFQFFHTFVGFKNVLFAWSYSVTMKTMDNNDPKAHVQNSQK